MCFASTSVTTPSIRANFRIMGSTRKVCTTGDGSAIPVVSRMIPSRTSFPESIRLASLCSTLTRSVRTVQHMQPLSTSKISSPVWNLVFFAKSLSSIATAPNSFSMMAIFFPCVAVRM